LVLTGSDGEPQASLYAFDRSTGHVVWKMPVPGGAPFDLQQRGSRGFALDMRGQVFSFEIATGRRLWTSDDVREEDSRPPGAPTLAGNRLFLASRTGTVCALEADSGRIAWKRSLNEKLNTGALFVEGHILIGTMGRRLYRLDAATGTTVATFETDGTPFGTLVDAGACVVSLQAPDMVACVEPDSGRAKWKQTTPKGISSFRPLIVGRSVIVGSDDGTVVAYALRDGREIWRRQVRGAARGLGVDADVLYVGTLKGTVAAIPLPKQAP
jgi:outer membrane protein assembly factor BamB